MTNPQDLLEGKAQDLPFPNIKSSLPKCFYNILGEDTGLLKILWGMLKAAAPGSDILHKAQLLHDSP